MKNVKVIEKDGQLYFYRLTLNQRIQHIVMFISFTLLAATGLPLKFHHTWWGEKLYPFVGGISFAPLIHRTAAIIITAVFIYHMFYVIVCAWKYYLKPLKDEGSLNLKTFIKTLGTLPMVPNLTDIKELIAALKYFFFITSERPALVAHGLKEKFGYLAVFWGIPVIGISGYFLWGETFFTKFFSGNVLNFAYIAHSDEAFLASIVIFIWHLYNVHLTPAVFPMGKSWLNGFMGEREIMQYHYVQYVKAMEDAGLKHRIRDLYVTDDFKGGMFKRIFMKAYMLLMIAAVMVATVVISKVIYESVFVFGYQIVSTEPHAEKMPLIEPNFIEEILLENNEEKTFYHGYRFVQEKEIKDHYHRIELGIGPDNTSHCIKCHGDLPHGKSVHVRAFLNMHNLYFACQTCHVRPKKPGEQLYYYWYKRSTGNIVFNPEINNHQIDSLGIKLTPCETCDSKPDRKEIEAERKLIKQIMKEINDKKIGLEEKKKIVEKIHANISKHPVYCNECHNRKKPFLRLAEVGYPEHRITMVANDQITKMINEYKEFHTPSFLQPGSY